MTATSFAAILLAAAGLCSCGSAGGQKFLNVSAPQPGKGLLYIYRYSRFAGTGVPAVISLPNEGRGMLHRSGFVAIDVAPGLKQIEATMRSNTQTLSTGAQRVHVAAGETKFVRVTPTVRSDYAVAEVQDSYGSSQMHTVFGLMIEEVPEQKAIAELKQCHVEPSSGQLSTASIQQLKPAAQRR